MNAFANQSNRFTSTARRAIAVLAVALSAILTSAVAAASGQESARPEIQMNDSFLWAMEVAFNQDFNGDGHIGQPPPPPGGGGGPGGGGPGGSEV